VYLHNFKHRNQNTFMKYAKNQKTAALLVIIASILLTTAKAQTPTQQPKTIQVAVLLDVSNSMDGLIEQTKSQLWTMVNSLGSAKCNGVSPTLQIALYEYGRSNNDAKNGFVKLINGFISNLDSLSENLFKLNTNGGQEYCGHAIYNSLNELQWSVSKEDYKVIFIAGNESFLQGNIKYTEACTLAAQKGVIVNTIYCGSKENGIREGWNLGGECNGGSFTNINSNAQEKFVPTPYDSIIYVLNNKINGTYITYGVNGNRFLQKQQKMDAMNNQSKGSAGLKRAQAKAKSAVYRNDDWDLVDAASQAGFDYSKIPTATLPDSLQKLNKEALQQYVQTKATERKAIQTEITQLYKKRELFIATERIRVAVINNEPTLESEMQKTLIEQAKLYGIVIE
jgi:hypothetical protein